MNFWADENVDRPIVERLRRDGHQVRYVIEMQSVIFPEKYTSDANHVAVAVVNHINYLASWNFGHLVRVQTRREVNLVNALLGFGAIEIVAPPEL